MDGSQATEQKLSWPRRMWRDHEEGCLYLLAALIYIPAGVFLRTIVLNWVVGILFPLLVVYLVPTFVRRQRNRAR